MRQVFFFSTPSDIRAVLLRFQGLGSPIKFALGDTLRTAERPVYFDVNDIPEPGIATHETGSASVGYLVCNRDVELRCHPTQSRSGQTHWHLRNGDTEGTASLVMAGLWRTGTLLPGSMATVHNDEAAQDLMKRFSRSLRLEGFTKVRSWWLGKEALQMLREGKRLTTTAEQSPRDFDLQLP